MPDVENEMSDEFHEWLSTCPCPYHKKWGEPTYTFYEDDEE